MKNFSIYQEPFASTLMILIVYSLLFEYFGISMVILQNWIMDSVVVISILLPAMAPVFLISSIIHSQKNSP